MTKKEPKSYLKEPYSRVLIPNQDGTYSAEILEFPGCFAEGDTADEAIRNLEAAAESWVEVSLAQGLEIPEPAMNQGYGGKIALRLPRNLHRRATQMAERDGTSLNQFLVSAIAARVGAEDLYTRLVERFERRFAMTSNPTSLGRSYGIIIRDAEEPNNLTVDAVEVNPKGKNNAARGRRSTQTIASKT
ncbi:MAG TPA: type II toxin-antitoxin system HicB family antitoxin [Chloroflexia bacterium]|jgi:predicted RNase H-like HicB family nuclease